MNGFSSITTVQNASGDRLIYVCKSCQLATANGIFRLVVIPSRTSLVQSNGCRPRGMCVIRNHTPCTHKEGSREASSSKRFLNPDQASAADA